MNQYFYSLNNEQKGAVSKDVLIELYRKGIINDNTFIWKQGYSQWLVLNETELYDEFKAFVPPPLNNLPPPIPSLNNNSAKTLEYHNGMVLFGFFICLIIYWIVYYFLSNAYCEGDLDNVSAIMIAPMVVYGVIVILLSIYDLSVLKKNNVNTSSLLIWSILFYPVSFYKRAKRLNSGLRLFYLSIITSILITLFSQKIGVDIVGIKCLTDISFDMIK